MKTFAIIAILSLATLFYYKENYYQKLNTEPRSFFEGEEVENLFKKYFHSIKTLALNITSCTAAVSSSIPPQYHKKSYTYSDPITYKGPIVKGWPPGESRFVPKYIKPHENTILTDLRCLNMDGISALILIQSSPGNLDRRESSRNTWIADTKDQFKNIKVLFVFGLPEEHENSINLENERVNYCDIVQFDFIDTYENVTLDMVSALKIANDYQWKVQPDFLLIGDDDTYLNIPSLHKYLFEEQILFKSNMSMVGSKFITPGVMKVPEEDKDKEFVDRVVCPSYMYDGDNYPDTLSGSAFVVPFDNVQCLYETALQLPLFHINDVFITGFVAEICGIERIGDQRFHPGTVSPENFKSKDISAHWCDSECKYNINELLLQKEKV